MKFVMKIVPFKQDGILHDVGFIAGVQYLPETKEVFVVSGEYPKKTAKKKTKSEVTE